MYLTTEKLSTINGELEKKLKSISSNAKIDLVNSVHGLAVLNMENGKVICTVDQINDLCNALSSLAKIIANETGLII